MCQNRAVSREKEFSVLLGDSQDNGSEGLNKGRATAEGSISRGVIAFHVENQQGCGN